jgi:hypothetical protein
MEITARRLHDEIAWRIRNHPDKPASLIRIEVSLALQTPEDAETKATIEGYVEAVRAMQTWPELRGGTGG